MRHFRRRQRRVPCRTTGKTKSAARLSVFSNTALIILKLATDLVTDSIAMMSEAVHSGLDPAASLVTLVSVKTSGDPSDDRHPVDHEIIENASGFIEELLIPAAWIVSEAIKKRLHPAAVN
ncbi:MAG: hypothetical protein AVO39_03885 [delta proteobacterium MLS_D]|nr:MAG: hypothetical protein AVO39_03885 [delta proteobacterium MLS_D]